MLCKGFPAVVGKEPVLLILGSMPGIKSLEQQQYYGHPRNVFWVIISEYFHFDIKLNYEDRLKQLKKNKIALWDVISECERQGSLDSNINKNSIQANNFAEFFKRHPTVKSIIFNGATAEKAFQQYVIKTEQLDASVIQKLVLQRLPSTSPANASIKKQEKFTTWKNTLDKCLN